MKANEQYSSVVLFIMLKKVILTFESVDKIPTCDHSKQFLSFGLREKRKQKRKKVQVQFMSHILT